MKDSSDNQKLPKGLNDLPKPRPYHISDPFQDRGLWCFWLAADEQVLEFVSTLNCILKPTYDSPFNRRLRGRVLFALNPRYEHEETWLWITEMLESETKQVQLNSGWEDAIDEAQTQQPKE